MKLRDYQQAAVRDALSAVEAGRKPVVCLPTGAGKSLVGAEILRSIADREPRRAPSALSITHTRELIGQNAAAFGRWAPDIAQSTYSAGLGEKDLSGRVVFAGVQSLVNSDAPIDPRVILVDEAHRIPLAETTQYGQVLARHSAASLVGLTATPYRLDSGLLHAGEGALFDTLLDGVSAKRLIDEGYLSPLSGVRSIAEMDTRAVHVRAGEFITSELEEIATDPECLQRVCRQIVQQAQERKRILVFGVSVAHAEALAETLSAIGCRSLAIHGKMPMEARDAALAAFRSGPVRALVNCMVLTTGFDQPDIDCVAVVRPTMSKGLFTQMLGRGLRRAEGKEDCLILDFGGNLKRHGDIDGLPEFDDQPQAAADRRASEQKERDLRTYAFALDQSDPNASRQLVEARVYGLTVVTEENKKNPALRQLRATYRTDMGSINIWLLPEHHEKARWHSGRWFARRGLSMPYKADMASGMARAAEIPESITITKDGAFWRVICEHFPDIPDSSADLF